MINHNAPVGMKIIWRAPVQCRDIKWWFDVPLLIDIASQFLHKRPQSKLFACRPSFRSTPLLRMISCDNIMPMICVKFEKQMAKENCFHLNFLKIHILFISIFALACSDSTTKEFWVGMMIVGTGGFKEIARSWKILLFATRSLVEGWWQIKMSPVGRAPSKKHHWG